MWDKNKAGGCMTMTSGLVLIGGVFLVAELSHMFIRKRINKKRKPYELQYAPVFFPFVLYATYITKHNELFTAFKCFFKVRFAV